jgi:hypothetical protein
LAGFQVTTIGRIWVTAEDQTFASLLRMLLQEVALLGHTTPFLSISEFRAQNPPTKRNEFQAELLG